MENDLGIDRLSGPTTSSGPSFASELLTPVRVGVMVDFGPKYGLKPEFFDGMPAEGVDVYGRLEDVEQPHRDDYLKRSALLQPGNFVPFGRVRDVDSYGLSIHFAGVWELGAPVYVFVDRKQAERRIADLVDRYWDLAHTEGVEGRSHDTPEGSAQQVRHELDEAIRLLR